MDSMKVKVGFPDQKDEQIFLTKLNCEPGLNGSHQTLLEYFAVSSQPIKNGHLVSRHTCKHNCFQK